MASLNISDLAGEAQTPKESLKKLSVLHKSSSESEIEDSVHRQTVSNKEVTAATDFFSAFQNKHTNKDAGYRLSRLKAYREDSQMQNLATAIFDFSLDDKKRFEFLFKFHASRIVDAWTKLLPALWRLQQDQ